MALYKNGTTLTRINEHEFKLEREIQNLFEENLEEIMNLKVVKSEFTIKDKRIDTLAFDTQENAFVIIEFKRSRNSSVVDQGFTYLNLMLNNKADFILEYNEQFSERLKRTDIEWSQTKVVFVAPTFTSNQREAVNFQDLTIELWEIKRYENNLISINPIKKSNTTESIKQIKSTSKKNQKVIDEIKTYTENSHLENKKEEIKELYYNFKDAILNLSPEIEIKPLKLYIAFKKENSNICSIVIRSNYLDIFINKKINTLDDSKNISKDVSNIGHWGTGNYKLKIKNDNNIEYIMSLIKQAIK